MRPPWIGSGPPGVQAPQGSGPSGGFSLTRGGPTCTATGMKDPAAHLETAAASHTQSQLACRRVQLDRLDVQRSVQMNPPVGTISSLTIEQNDRHVLWLNMALKCVCLCVFVRSMTPQATATLAFIVERLEKQLVCRFVEHQKLQCRSERHRRHRAASPLQSQY